MFGDFAFTKIKHIYFFNLRNQQLNLHYESNKISHLY